MESFLQQEEGPEATVIKMLRTEVDRLIGVNRFALGTNYTPTGKLGNSYGGWGALPTLDILAKAGSLIANGGTALDGTQSLSVWLLGTFTKSANYQRAFWKTTTKLNGADIFVPTMGRAGGHLVVSLPNKTSIVILCRNNYNASVPGDKLAALVDVVLSSKN